MVYTNDSNILVNNAKNMLISEGISISVRNEHASTGAHVNLAQMEVWVKDDKDYSRAIEILSALKRSEPNEEWVCSQCGEKNDESFDTCWKCSSEP